MSPPRRRWRREPVDLASQLGRYRRRSGSGGDVAQVQDAWRDLVGPQVGRQTVVVRRSKAGVVSIACASSSWAQELDGRREYWVAELARRCAPLAISGVRFVVGDHVMPDGPPGERPTVLPTAAELAAAASQTPEIADETLRELLIRAQAGQMALARERKRLQKADNGRRGSRPD